MAAIAVFGVFVVGYDQGQIFSIVQGNEAFLIKVLEFGLDTKRYPAQSAAIHILLFLSTVNPTGWLQVKGIKNSCIVIGILNIITTK